MEKQINEQIEELLNESLDEVANINIQASPFATKVNISINEGYIKKIASFVNGDENKIQEIIKRHANYLGEEISNYIKSCNNNIDEEQSRIHDDILRILGIKTTK